MGKYAASLDIRKAYRQLLVSYKDSMLRLSIWFRDPQKKKEMVIIRTATCDFGYSQASLALRFVQDKYIAANCHTKLGLGYSPARIRLLTIICSAVDQRRKS